MKIDKRTKKYRLYKALISKEMLCVFLLGLLAGAILGKSIYDGQQASKNLLDPRGGCINGVCPTPPPFPKKEMSLNIVKVVEAKEELSWSDAIRQVFPADEAGRMIRICLKESGNKYAINWNTNGTFDYSWCQVNSCHKPKDMTNEEWKKNLDDPIFNAQQVRKIYLSQGWSAWVVFNKGLAK